MPTPENLTLCICVHNGENEIGRCLESVTKQVSEGIFKVVVVNHNSVDKTSSILRCYEMRSPWLRVFNFEGHGLGAARQAALSHAATDWVAFIDADCELTPGWVKSAQVHISKFDPRMSIGAFGGAARVPSLASSPFYECLRLFLDTFIGGHDSPLNRSVHVYSPKRHLPTVNVIYRRLALEKAGGFRAEFTQAGEDLDVSFRLSRRGYSLIAVPKMEVAHYGRRTLGSWLGNMILYGRARVAFHGLTGAPWELKFLVPPALVALYLVGICLSLTGTGGGLFLAILFLAILLMHIASIAMVLLMRKFQLGQSLPIWLYSTFVLWLTHLSYGIGMLTEIWVCRGVSRKHPSMPTVPTIL